ncbi:FIG021862: membrane protein, exporter [hydrothermal vent metagenome]|uniref:FIG021862: membrane protein, exporter n=1 Tax=hydrothermal vent metagenome TaxID=652676 RepID=A0A3B0Z8G0_9ZZZZ
MQTVSRLFHRFHHATLGVLVVLTVLIFVFIVGMLKQGLAVDTDLSGLLPRDTHNELVQSASDRLLKKVGNRIVLLVGASELDEALGAAKFVEQVLMDNAALQWPGLDNISDQQFKIIDLYRQYQHHLLTQENRDQLLVGDDEKIVSHASRLLYGLESWSRITTPQEDPLGLLNEFMLSLSADDNVHSILNGFVVLDARSIDGRYYILLTANLDAGMMNMTAQETVDIAVKDVAEQLGRDFPGVNLLKSGMVFHAAQAAEKAKKEASIIAVGSVIGIMVLFFLAFGSPYPLLLSLGSVVFGCLTAVTISSYIFPQIHVLTLVFGASLIGVTIDYSLHYFARLHGSQLSGSRLATLRSIFPSILLGAITTVVGYSFLMQAALPGLIQISIFSVAGVIGAWLFVVGVYPLVIRDSHAKSPAILLSVALFPTRFWHGLTLKMIAIIMMAIIISSTAINLYLMKASDNVRLLHVPSAELIEQEQKIQQIFRNYAPNQFYLVTADSEQALLRTEELFLPALDRLVSRSAIRSYDAITHYLPSIQRQALNYKLLASSLYGMNGSAERFMVDAGFDEVSFESYRQKFIDSENEYLLPEEWLRLASEDQSTFWLGKIGAVHASLITLYGVSDTDALRNAADDIDGVIFVNKIDELTNVMGMQRESASLLLVTAYIAVMLLLLLYYRKIHSLALVFVPAVSTLLTLVIITIAGSEVTIFHVFAMFLILGLGMDYSIFIYESSGHDEACLLAVTLSAFTSCLSFGLLSLSSTPMLHAFGMMILLGSIFNLFLAPLVRVIPNRSMVKNCHDI